MQKFIFIFSFLLIANFSFAQVNLVPNFSFEQNDTCPNSQDQIQYATGWSKYSDVSSTPDYYNSCAPATSFGVPLSPYVNQADHRNCRAYAGLLIWGAAGSEREQIGIKLTQPLIIGQKYFLSFYTVLTECYIAGMYFGIPSNNIGLRLSTIPYNGSNPVPLNNFAHLNSSAVISDSLNWQRITGSIIADSAYEYVILGNFFDDSNTTTVPYSCGSCFNTYSYYLYDDVCVSSDSLLTNGGIDVLPCTVSVSEIKDNWQINIFPNPSYNIITFSFNENQWEEIRITDLFGKLCFTERVNGGNSISVDISSFNSGVYFLNGISKNKKQFLNKKIIKL